MDAAETTDSLDLGNIAVVQANLGSVGQGTATVLYDDGAHSDGAATAQLRRFEADPGAYSPGGTVRKEDVGPHCEGLHAWDAQQPKVLIIDYEDLTKDCARPCVSFEQGRCIAWELAR